MSNPPPDSPVRFSDLALGEPLLQALADVGYEAPSPIQAATIPPLLAGRDVLGQAQTGTGKTAAFALPVLAQLDFSRSKPQALVLTPTRELAIQVAEAFQKYAARLPGFHVLPIYGGQSYGPQLAALRRGVQVIVGTPGRIIDHLDRGSLDLSELRCLVLDEADEMLRMGFIDDVEAVLKKTPATRQVALFSATMPTPIRRIAQTYLREPVEIAIEAKTRTADNIRQRYWLVGGLHKLDALTRILEVETFDAMIIFARTKQATEELAEKLAARGFAAAAINGDIAQPQRERTIERLKNGQLDILVATDVAARGLDVERISHVLNYDIPYDTESYVHRIGRTGRAGRSGEAVLFVSPRERGMLRSIERATRQPIEPMSLPSVEAVNDQRVAKFFSRIEEVLEHGPPEPYRSLIERYETEHDIPAAAIAAALAQLMQGDVPLLLKPEPPRAEYSERPRPGRNERAEQRQRGDSDRYGRDTRAPRGGERTDSAPERGSRFERSPHGERPERAAGAERFDRGERPGRPPATTERAAPRHDRSPSSRPGEPGMQRYRIEVGHRHGVKPGNIVGAIANEAGLESRFIGRIEIYDEHSVLDLPEGMPKELEGHLAKVRVAGQALRIRPAGAEDEIERPRGPRPFRAGPPRPGDDRRPPRAGDDRRPPPRGKPRPR